MTILEWCYNPWMEFQVPIISMVTTVMDIVNQMPILPPKDLCPKLLRIFGEWSGSKDLQRLSC